MLFSGAVDTFQISNEVYHTLIPAMVEALTELQTTYPYPPDPEVYEGEYSLIGIPGQLNVNIVTFQDQLLMTGPLNVFLAYRDPLHLQVYNSQKCYYILQWTQHS
jgi:hypothetical protein